MHSTISEKLSPYNARKKRDEGIVILIMRTTLMIDIKTRTTRKPSHPLKLTRRGNKKNHGKNGTYTNQPPHQTGTVRQ